jgi:hypothetical protein
MRGKNQPILCVHVAKENAKINPTRQFIIDFQVLCGDQEKYE